ncbi:hypothetical protein D5R81_16695 [Parashewanella spongiae]|uniref:Uncharacterized protein n=1 Tax=Parashewanella spongiae TaxID=342950 RepID=A0A3A6TIV0_9GAMM|nr:beta-propeller fold lactonase family protein [Parashewanella spongiae]MCL1079674.1 lactonase family protein [Parashewanella spongiae]RJY07050.1 hypothetical protein D5R81_16695 [Parashewanella spongiae]
MNKCFTLILTAVAGLLIAACDNIKLVSTPTQPNQDTRFIYTSNNAVAGNQVIGFRVNTDGSLTEFGAFNTGGAGDSDDGDFDTQGTVRVFGNTLIVMNAGEETTDPLITNGNGSLSTFNINPDTGRLTRIDQQPSVEGVQNIDSFGVRPVSVDVVNAGGTTWVVVANQQNTPHCLTPTAERTLETCLDQSNNPISDFLNEGKDNERNLHLFTMDEGVLTPVRQLTTYTAEMSGPAQVRFSPDGSTLAVTTVGIVHVAYPADESLQSPSHVFLYDVTANNNNFSIDNPRFFANYGIAASVGFSWSNNNDYLYVSSSLLSEAMIDNSITVLDVNNTDTVFSSDRQSQPSGNGAIPSTDRPGACWTWLSADNNNLYAVTFVTNSIVNFSVDGNVLQQEQQIYRREAPQFDSKDIFVTNNGRYLYVLGSISSHVISMFTIESDGLLIEQDASPLEVQSSRPDGVNTTEHEQFYIGIAGYPAGHVGS